MKLLKIILCFTVVLLMISITSADTGHIDFSGTKQIEQGTESTGVTTAVNWYTGVTFMNPENTLPGSVDWVTCNCAANMFKGPDGTQYSSSWSGVTLKVAGVEVGTGSFGYMYANNKYYIGLFPNDDFDISGYSGQTHVTIHGGMQYRFSADGSGAKTTGVNFNLQESDTAIFGYSSGGYGLGIVSGSDHTLTMSYHQEFDYTYSNNVSYYFLNFTHTTGHNASLKILSGARFILNESTPVSSHYDIYDTGIENTTWIMTVENTLGDSSVENLYFGVGSIGTIELNQTLYTEPEPIQIDVELTAYNFTYHSYYIITEVSEDLDYWDNVAGTYNGTTKITTNTTTRVLDVDTWLYDLPIWIRSRLVDYNKLTGEYTTLDTTPAVLFNPPIPDSIKFGGTVIDADTNQIISGATVSVEGVTTTSDTTNAFGEFLMYLYPGIYTVTASKTGYQTYTSEELLMEVDNTWAQIYLTPIGYGNGTLYGNVNDVDTGYAIQDVHVIITNATDSFSAYTSSGGYYETSGLAQSSTYTIRALKTGYYTYNGSVTTEATGATHKSFNMVPETATPTPTATVLPTSTYPGGEGHEWTNDEIVTMLRVLVPGFFLLMLVFLLLAVMLGIGGNNGNSGQGRSGLSEIWRR